MRRARETIRALLGGEGGERGQSLVEFAVIAPVIVGVLIFAIWFYEATQIKLKQQEAERYVVWEFTGKQLTDYDDPSRNDSLYDEAREDIVTDAMERYDDLVSYTTRTGVSRYVMASWELTPPRVSHGTPPEVPGGYWLSLAFQIFKTLYTTWDAQQFDSPNRMHRSWMWGSETQPRFAGSGAISQQFDAARHWEFNGRGLVSAKMRWRIAPTTAFTGRFMDDRFGKPFRPFGASTLDDRAAPEGLVMVVDHWNLQDGRPAGMRRDNRGQDRNHPYWKQLERMSFVTSSSRGIANRAANSIVELLNRAITGGMQAPLRTNPMETALAAGVYGPENNDLGRRTVQTDRGNVRFDTAPYAGEYEQTFETRGEWFMGCPEGEQLGCNGGLGQDNPFGDYIITGEGQ